MSRPRKWRRVCALPERKSFGPLDVASDPDIVVMSVDEYETIRLIDYEGLNQEECASHMQVARTTVQGIYIEARKKLASSLVDGKVLVIKGGAYQLCDGFENNCGGFCRRERRRGNGGRL